VISRSSGIVGSASRVLDGVLRVVSSARPSHRRAVLVVSRLCGCLGLALYNWWIAVLLTGGVLTSRNEFFSDLEARGASIGAVLSHVDIAAGTLLLVALVLRGSDSPAGRRREHLFLVIFAAAGAIGGLFTYSCAEGVDASCRAAEWRLQLPWTHYAHVVAGIVEFAAATWAIVVARRRVIDDEASSPRLVASMRSLSWLPAARSGLSDRSVGHRRRTGVLRRLLGCGSR